MGSSTKILSGSFWSVVVTIVNAIYGFIAVPILINHFGNAEYGLIGLATSINVYMNLMDMGLNTTNVRFFSLWLSDRNYEKVSKLFKTNLAFYGIVGLINASALIVVYFFSDSLFNVTEAQDQILKNLLLILSVSAVISWYTSCFEQMIRATENVGWYQRMLLISKLTMVIVLILTVCLDLTIEVYFALTLIAGFITLPLIISKIKNLVPHISFWPKLDVETFKEILPYSLNIFSFSIFQFSFQNLRPVFLGMQGTIESITDFRIMNGIVSLVAMFGGIFSGVIMPSATRAVAQVDSANFNKIAYSGTKYITIFLCLLVFGLMTISKDLITVYVGDDFLHLVPWMYIWLLTVLGNHNQAISALMLSYPDLRELSYMTATSCIVGLIITWCTIPLWGVGGVVVALAAYTIMQLLFYYTYYWPKKLQISGRKVLFESVMPPVLIGTVCFVTCVLLPHTNNYWANILIFGSLFVLSYLLVSAITTKKTERQYIYNLIKDLKK